jgi:uncharacterized protein with FMN-binding domain
MRRSSAVILATVSSVTLAAAWAAGSGVWRTAPTLAPVIPPSADPNGSAAPSAPMNVDGAVIDTKYGTVQVQAVILDQVITDVIAVKLTDSSEESVEISARAAPILRDEVLAAQSAEVDVVSSATYTSEAYLTSLQSALDAVGFTGVP